MYIMTIANICFNLANSKTLKTLTRPNPYCQFNKETPSERSKFIDLHRMELKHFGL